MFLVQGDLVDPVATVATVVTKAVEVSQTGSGVGLVVVITKCTDHVFLWY